MNRRYPACRDETVHGPHEYGRGYDQNTNTTWAKTCDGWTEAEADTVRMVSACEMATLSWLDTHAGRLRLEFHPSVVDALRMMWQPTADELLTRAVPPPLAKADIVIVADLPRGAWRLVEPAVPLAFGTIRG